MVHNAPDKRLPSLGVTMGMCVSGHAVWHNAGNFDQNARVARKHSQFYSEIRKMLELKIE